MAKRKKDLWIDVLDEGGLHRSLKVPKNESVPPTKLAAALAGEYGEKAKKQAVAAKTLRLPEKTQQLRNKRKHL